MQNIKGGITPLCTLCSQLQKRKILFIDFLLQNWYIFRTKCFKKAMKMLYCKYTFVIHFCDCIILIIKKLLFNIFILLLFRPFQLMKQTCMLVGTIILMKFYFSTVSDHKYEISKQNGFDKMDGDKNYSLLFDIQATKNWLIKKLCV